MPIKMRMNLNSLNSTIDYKNINYTEPLANNSTVFANARPTASLNSSMIQRIYTTKPGCSSCGR